MSGQLRRESGFTLLEVMVATLIMGIAVVGLLGNLHVSLRNTDRVATHDRATLFAQHKMDELIAQTTLPLYTKVGGAFPDGGDREQGGWQAVVTSWEAPPRPTAGELVLARIDLQIWWMEDNRRRTFSLEGFRHHMLTPDEASRVGPGS